MKKIIFTLIVFNFSILNLILSQDESVRILESSGQELILKGSNFVFNDENGDGIMNVGEDPIEGVQVSISNPVEQKKSIFNENGYIIEIINTPVSGASYNAVTQKTDQIGDQKINGSLDVCGNISKLSGTFKIDHPLDPKNKYLYHSFVESPDMMNIYNGNVTTDADGNATVELPHYFEVLNMEFRYQLTVIGEFAQAIISEKINGNHFKVKTDKPNIEVSWLVTGIRNDPYAQENRIQVEVEKGEVEKGKLLYEPQKLKTLTSKINSNYKKILKH